MDLRSQIIPGLVAGALAFGAVAAPGQGRACVLAPPRPGESAEAMKSRLASEWAEAQARRQRDLRTSADKVFTARVRIPDLAEAPTRPYDPRRDGPPRPPRVPVIDPYGGETTWTIEPLESLKGERPARPFEIVQTMSMTSCGPAFGFGGDAMTFSQDMLEPEGRIVVFLKGPYPTQSGMLATIKPGDIVDADLKAALAQAAP